MRRQNYDFETIIPKFDAILQRGLCQGIGERDGQMCIEAAICAVMDFPHGDNPSCVEPAIRSYKIRLNDSGWSTPQARAQGLRDLGIAQIGSHGVVDGREFVTRLAEQTIRVLLPVMIRETPRFAKNRKLMALVDKCEHEGSKETARELSDYLYADAAYDAAYAAAYAAYSAAYAAAYDAAYSAAYAAAYAAYDAAYARRDRILRLSASLALQILIDLKSPGAEWIDANAVEKLRG